MLDSWTTLRKKANILFAIDTSGSMMATYRGPRPGSRSRPAAAAKGLQLLNTEDRVGLWSFSSETPQRPKAPYRRGDRRSARFDETRLHPRSSPACR